MRYTVTLVYNFTNDYTSHDGVAGRIYCLALGLVYTSVCAPKDVTRDAIEAHVNAENPTGIESRWRISEDKHFESGEPNPCPCPDVPDRLHYLLSC